MHLVHKIVSYKIDIISNRYYNHFNIILYKLILPIYIIINNDNSINLLEFYSL